MVESDSPPAKVSVFTDLLKSIWNLKLAETLIGCECGVQVIHLLGRKWHDYMVIRDISLYSSLGCK